MPGPAPPAPSASTAVRNVWLAGASVLAAAFATVCRDLLVRLPGRGPGDGPRGAR